jgi:hypothetical protein
MPWLYVLGDAIAAADQSGQEEALFHMAAAQRIEDRFDTPLGPILDAAGSSNANLAAANAMAVDAIGVSAAQEMPALAVTKPCSASAVLDANRKQLCTAVATLLADRSDTLLLRMMGVSLDARLTGDRSRLERFRARPKDPLFERLEAPTSCAELRSNALVLRRLAQVGEVAVLREATSNSDVFGQGRKESVPSHDYRSLAR